MDDPHDLSRGASVGRYVVLGKLGRGAMGAVYRAYDPSLDRQVALKLLIPRPNAGEEGHRRLVAEARAMARLRHPNVITVHDVGEHDDKVYVAMELVDGKTLRQWLDEGLRPWTEVVDVFGQAARGLAAAHAAGLVHRDFKPDNVMMDPEGRVLVMDFGLARSLGDVQSEDGTGHISGPLGSEDLTRTGSLLGTPAYMSPEQVRHRPVEPASDQFSFCIALYEALAGERPFKGSTLSELSSAISAGRYDALSGKTDAPATIVQLVEVGLSTDPTQRHSNMDALVEGLQLPKARSSRGPVWAMVGLGAAGLVFVATRDSAEDKCERGSSRVAEVWSEQRAGELAAGFDSLGIDYAMPAWRRASSELDGWATQWTDAFTTACVATEVDGAQSAARFDAQAACLDQLRDEVQIVLQTFETPDEALARTVIDIAEGLPAPQRCLERRADDAPPTRLQRETSLQLAKLQVDYDRGRHGQVAAELDAVLTALGEEPAHVLRARALLGRGRAQEKLGNADASIESYREALLHAERATGPDVPHLKVSIWQDLVHVHSTLAGRRQEAETLLIPMSVSLEAADPDAAQRVNAMIIHAGVRLSRDRAKEALEISTEALALANQEGVEGAVLEHLHQSLALNFMSVGESNQAVEHARTMVDAARQRLGSTHPRVGELLGTLASVCVQAEDYECARVAIEDGVAIFEPLGPDGDVERATLLVQLGRLRLASSDAAEARLPLEHALEILDGKVPAGDVRLSATAATLSTIAKKTGDHEGELKWLETAEKHARQGTSKPAVANLLNRRGNLERRAGNLDAALALFEESNSIYVESGDSLRRCPAILNVAEVKLELGRADDAIESARDALAECGRRDKEERLKGFAHLAVSKALWEAERRRDRDAARDHADKAAALAHSAGSPDLTEETAEWSSKITSDRREGP